MTKNAINSNNAPQAIGPYSPAVKLGDFLFFSGQIAIDPSSGEMIEGDVGQQTSQVMKNIIGLLSELYLETRHIVKTTVFLSDMKDFNEFNEEYAKYFDEPYPARSTVQVAALPKNAKVEIECLVIDTLAYEMAECGGCNQQDCPSDCGGCSNE